MIYTGWGNWLTCISVESQMFLRLGNHLRMLPANSMYSSKPTTTISQAVSHSYMHAEKRPWYIWFVVWPHKTFNIRSGSSSANLQLWNLLDYLKKNILILVLMLPYQNKSWCTMSPRNQFSDFQTFGESSWIFWRTNFQPVRLLVSASPNQPANSVFLSQKTSTSQHKPAPAPTSEQAICCLQTKCRVPSYIQ